MKNTSSAASIGQAGAARSSPAYPLSFQQQALWLLSQLTPLAQRCAFSLCYEFRFEGRHRTEAMEQAISALSIRHPMLCTRIGSDEGEPWQTTGEEIPSFSVVGLQESADPESAANGLVQLEAETAVSTENGPLARFTLLKLSAEKCRLLMNIHHLVADGLSVHILRRDLAAFYTAFATGAASLALPPAASYRQFVMRQIERKDSGGFGEDELYWLREFPAEPEPFDLPSDYSRGPARSFRGGSLSVCLDGETLRMCQRASFRQHAPVSAFLLAAFVALLMELTGRRRMVVGTSFAGRTDGKSWREAVGLFANTTPLQMDVRRADGWKELLAHASSKYVGAYDHQEYPMQLLIEKLAPSRQVCRPVLFQVAYNFQATAVEQVEWEGLVEAGFRQVPTPTSTFDLLLHVTACGNDSATARFDYCADLFAPASIAAMAERYLQMLARAVRDN
jgi:hypothetical protein